MRLYAAGNKILLDPEPLTAKEVGRNARFKAQDGTARLIKPSMNGI